MKTRKVKQKGLKSEQRIFSFSKNQIFIIKMSKQHVLTPQTINQKLRKHKIFFILNRIKRRNVQKKL